MTGISHKQAIKRIDRRLDELLDERQLISLEEHLRSCDSCRAYSAEMDQLPARLQEEFQIRWDNDPGLSQKFIEEVTKKARNLPVTNRISSGVKVIAGVAALVALVFLVNFVVSQLQSASTGAIETQPAGISSLKEDRLLAFTSEQSGNFDIYTMHADGIGLTNLTNNFANDFNPFWSPDGRRIAFESDRDGSMQIFLMDADGSDLTQLTDGEAKHEFRIANPWSPDGSRLIFTERALMEDKWVLHVMDADGQNKIQLVRTPNSYGAPSWSPDSEHIAFDLVESGENRDKTKIYVVDKDGSNLTNVTKLLPKDEDLMSWNFLWASDGQSISFVAGRHAWENNNSRSVVYEASLDGNTLTETFVTSDYIEDWWDGTAFVHGFGLPLSLAWVRSDGTTSTLKPFENCQTRETMSSMYKRSPNGTLLYGTQCADDDLWLYWANPDGTSTKQLLDFSISAKDGGLVDISWSQDDALIAFTVASPAKTEMYVLNVKEALTDPSVRPDQYILGESGFIPYNVSWQP